MKPKILLLVLFLLPSLSHSQNTAYDDNFDNRDGTFGAVELMNSWGTSWGDGGFIHVKYQDLPKILNYAVSLYDDIRPVPPPEPPKPQPVPQPQPKPQPVPDTLKRMEGSFTLLLSDGTSMQAKGDKAAFRKLRSASAGRRLFVCHLFERSIEYGCPEKRHANGYR